jgi:hypothetical protein
VTDTQTIATLRRLAEHLASEVADARSRCELTTDTGSGRCKGGAAAVRWEAGFADVVCQHHADTATERGAVVVQMRRHDGSAI